jgi:hypothetical protein
MIHWSVEELSSNKKLSLNQELLKQNFTEHEKKYLSPIFLGFLRKRCVAGVLDLSQETISTFQS